MTAEELKNVAIYSADKYYNYLNDNGKGRSTTRVSKILVKGNEVLLYVSSAFSRYGLDGCIFHINANDYTAHQLGLSDYDIDLGCLRLFPKPEYLLLFHDLLPSQITIDSDLTFLVRRVRDWYEKNGSLLHLPHIAPSVPIPDKSDLSGGSASDEQYAAVCGALSSPFSYVWGAPGTGKTRFVLANCVLSYVRQNKKVVLLAPTNNAVDQMLSGVLEVLRANSIPDHFSFRYGLPTRAFCAKYPAVCETKSFNNYKKHLEKQVESITTRLQTYDRISFLQSVSDASAPLPALLQDCKDLSSQKKPLNDKLKQINDEILRNENEIKRVQRLISYFDIWKKSFPGLTCRFFRPRYYATLLSNQERDESTLISLVSKSSSLRSDKASIISALSDLTEKIESSESSFYSSLDSLNSLLRSNNLPYSLQSASSVLRSSNVSSSDLQYFQKQIDHAIFLCQQELDAQKLGISSPDLLRQKLQECQSRLDHLNESFSRRMNDVLVHAMTIDRFINKTADSLSSLDKISHIFLDESAYTSLARGMTLLAYDLPVTLLGDHAQLPPICEMKQEQHPAKPFCDPAYLWSQSIIYAETMFSCIPEELCADCLSPTFSSLKIFPLTVTYRFGSSLSDILSRFCYSTYGLSSAPGRHVNLYFVDCPRLHGDDPLVSSSEVSAASSIASSLDASKTEYAILTPYRKQRDALTSALKTAAKSDRILTIHASQGREFHTVIVSIVDTFCPYFCNSDTSHGLSVLNTAISRVKKNLVLLADYDAWDCMPSQMVYHLLRASSPL